MLEKYPSDFKNLYTQKIVQTPYMTRVYTYKKYISHNFTVNRETYEKSHEGDKQEISLRRTRDNLALLIQCNIKPYSKFLTLTTQENIQERSVFLDKFKAFKRAFKRKYGYAIKYSAVMETQKRGAWHIHLVAYNLTQKLDYQEIDRLWQRVAGKGHVDFKVVDSHKNMFKYLIKYLTKEETQINKKAILNSQGLERPEIITTRESYDYQTIYGEPNFKATWTLYHGDRSDFENGNVNMELFDSCDMHEWHK
mgnify:FL=1